MQKVAHQAIVGAKPIQSASSPISHNPSHTHVRGVEAPSMPMHGSTLPPFPWQFGPAAPTASVPFPVLPFYSFPYMPYYPAGCGPAPDLTLFGGQQQSAPGVSPAFCGMPDSAPTMTAVWTGPPLPSTLPELPSLPASDAQEASCQAQGVSMVLVAKRLTDSDVTYGRIILPRVAVEANLRFVLGFRSHNLPVVDHQGKPWEFVIKSWANGNEKRRVYALEQASTYLRTYKLAVKDCIGLSLEADGSVRVQHNTPAVVAATRRSGATRLNQGPELQLAFLKDGASGAALKCQPLLVGGPVGVCSRSAGCTKLAGHPGFCSGPREGVGPPATGPLGKRASVATSSGEDESEDGRVDGRDWRPRKARGLSCAAKLAASLLDLQGASDTADNPWAPLTQCVLGGIRVPTKPRMMRMELVKATFSKGMWTATQGGNQHVPRKGSTEGGTDEDQDSMAAAVLLHLHTAPSCEEDWTKAGTTIAGGDCSRAISGGASGNRSLQQGRNDTMELPEADEGSQDEDGQGQGTPGLPALQAVGADVEGACGGKRCWQPGDWFPRTKVVRRHAVGRWLLSPTEPLQLTPDSSPTPASQPGSPLLKQQVDDSCAESRREAPQVQQMLEVASATN